MPLTATRKTAASGSAVGVDAARTAVAEAVSGVRAPGLVLVFPTSDVLGPALAAEAAGGCPTAGMTVSATLTDAGPALTGCAAIAFDEALPSGIGVSRSASSDLVGAARNATAAALADVPPDTPFRVVLLFADTRSGDQAEVVAGSYAAAGPHVPLAGGGAGGPRPAQFAHGRPLDDSVVAVAIGSAEPIGLGIADGCRPVGVPSIVTRAHGRTLLELDGRPAETVYLEKLAHLGAPRTDREFERFAVLHPLAQPELSGDRRLRHVLGRTGDGGLYCATAVASQAAVEFMVQDRELVVDSAHDAVSRALAPLEGRSPVAALAFDCAGRKRALDDDLELEALTIRSAFGRSPPPLAGGYTHGEVGRGRGAKGDRNHALVVVAIA